MTDIDFLKAYLSRHQTPSYRQYELAGVAHIPPDIVDLRLTGATRQNPVSFRPVYKAMLRNLVEWIGSGTLPPDSQYIEGTVEREGQFHFATDADGNVTGGVRLPHMPAVLPNGERAGAPLGVYGGLDLDYLNPRQPVGVAGRDLRALLGRGACRAVPEPGGLRAVGPYRGSGVARQPLHPSGGLQTPISRLPNGGGRALGGSMRHEPNDRYGGCTVSEQPQGRGRVRSAVTLWVLLVCLLPGTTLARKRDAPVRIGVLTVSWGTAAGGCGADRRVGGLGLPRE